MEELTLGASGSILPIWTQRRPRNDAIILDTFGDPVASMAELWRLVSELKASNMALTTRVSELTAEVLVQGGSLLRHRSCSWS